MHLKRRDFLRLSAGSSMLYGMSSFTNLKGTPLDDLKPMANDIVPITTEERLHA